jgi:hypothetical protein
MIIGIVAIVVFLLMSLCAWVDIGKLNEKEREGRY